LCSCALISCGCLSSKRKAVAAQLIDAVVYVVVASRQGRWGNTFFFFLRGARAGLILSHMRLSNREFCLFRPDGTNCCSARQSSPRVSNSVGLGVRGVISYFTDKKKTCVKDRVEWWQAISVPSTDYGRYGGRFPVSKSWVTTSSPDYLLSSSETGVDLGRIG
jgi:hypothetical protein